MELMKDSDLSLNTLISTVRNGNADDLAKLLELEGLDANDKRNNCLALTFAIINKDIEKIELLLSYCCSTNSTDIIYTPLHYAMDTNNQKIVELLLDSGALLVTNSVSTVKSPLYQAMRGGQLELVDLMLSIYNVKQIDPNSKQESVNFNIACIRNNVKLVKAFIRKGMNVNQTLDYYADDWAGCSPLFLSVKYLSVEVVEILLNYKADFTFQDKYKTSPLHLAYYIWKNNNNTSDEIENASDIIDLIVSAHTRNLSNPVDLKGVTHFQISCTRGNATLVYYFLQSGISANTPIFPQNSTARAPLHLAIEYNRKEIVRILLENKANVNAKNANDLTPLELAFEKKFYGIAELLLEYKAVVSIKELNEYNIIFQAFADYRHWISSKNKIIDLVFSAWQETIVNTTNQDGLSLLHVACTRKNIDIIEKLLLSTVDVNAFVHKITSKWAGYTALHFAAFFQNLNAIRVLLKRGADVNAVDKNGFTPLWLSLKAQPNHTMIDNAICDKFNESDSEDDSENEEDLIDYVSDNLKNIQTIELLVESNCNLNYKSNLGESLLMGAYQSFVSQFIKTDRNSEVIISELCQRYLRYSARKIISCLIDVGIDVNILDNQNNHILHYIALSVKNHQYVSLALEIGEIIMKTGVNVNVLDQNENTPLHIATLHGSLKLMDLFMRFNADVNAKNNAARTPLHIAVDLCLNANRHDIGGIAHSDALKIVESLLMAKCNVDVQSSNGETPLSIAAAHVDLDCLKLLLDYGADVNLKAWNNATLLEKVASEYECMNFQDYYIFQVLKELLWHSFKLISIGDFVDTNNRLRVEQYEKKRKFYYRKIYICEDEGDDDSSIPRGYITRLQEELDELKGVRIDDDTSLYDILLMNEQQIIKRMDKKCLEVYVHSETFKTDFPNYEGLLKLKFRNALASSLIIE